MLHYFVNLPIQAYMEPVPLKCRKLAIKYTWRYRYFLQCRSLWPAHRLSLQRLPGKVGQASEGPLTVTCGRSSRTGADQWVHCSWCWLCLAVHPSTHMICPVGPELLRRNDNPAVELQHRNSLLDVYTRWRHLANTVKQLCAVAISKSATRMAMQLAPKLLWTILLLLLWSIMIMMLMNFCLYELLTISTIYWHWTKSNNLTKPICMTEYVIIKPQ